VNPAVANEVLGML